MNREDYQMEYNVDFGDMPSGPFLLGLLSTFDNRYQAIADMFFEDITWKQFFAIICINLCKTPPSINELADIMGSSHQNVKQILIKLEKREFVRIVVDEEDRRKQRVFTTQKCRRFCEDNESESNRIIGRIFDGISEEEINTTIQTISKMERNVKSL